MGIGALRKRLGDEREAVRPFQAQIQVRDRGQVEIGANLRVVPEQAVARVKAQTGIQQDIAAEALPGDEAERLHRSGNRQADLYAPVEADAHTILHPIPQPGTDTVSRSRRDACPTKNVVDTGGPGREQSTAAVDGQDNSCEGTHPEKQGSQEDHDGSGQQAQAAFFHTSILIQIWILRICKYREKSGNQTGPGRVLKITAQEFRNSFANENESCTVNRYSVSFERKI